MEWLVKLLAEQSLLLLFVIAVFGHVIGGIKIKGISLGVAAVLFVGLTFSALDKDLILPSFYTSLGLVMFVYSIGIASGPSFFNSLKNKGVRDNSIVAGALALGALASIAIYYIIHISPAVTAGMFTGILTNTPALAGVVGMLSNGSLGADATKLATLPAVGYSIAYPMGVLGPILAIAFWQRFFKIDYKKDAKAASNIMAVGDKIHSRAVKITSKKYCGHAIKSLSQDNHWNVVFGRVARGDEEWLSVTKDTTLELGDIMMVIGNPDTVEMVINELGEPSNNKIDEDHSHYNRHSMFVTSNATVGHKIRDLHLPQLYGAMITRVRRGDVDMLAHKDLVLEPGDSVRIVCCPDRVSEVRKCFGDSYRAASSINILGIGIGISLGLILGSIPLDLPGGVVFRLGDAGGPLIVGLILGFLRRSGRMVWSIPYTANLTLREFGLILMLAGIGTRSGQTFIHAINGSNGLLLFSAAALVSIAIPFVFLPVAYKFFKIPFGVATGMMAAVHTQPAAHAYAIQQANNDLPNHGYAIAFPTATIVKVILSQVILLALL